MPSKHAYFGPYCISKLKCCLYVFTGPTKCTRKRTLGFQNPRAFVPSCNKDGSFKEKQCHGSYCFCVNRDGKEIPGSRVEVGTGEPNCRPFGKPLLKLHPIESSIGQTTGSREKKGRGKGRKFKQGKGKGRLRESREKKERKKGMEIRGVSKEKD